MATQTAQAELTTSAGTIYTAARKGQITACDAFNKTGTARTVTVYVIKAADTSASAATCVYVGTVPDNASGSHLQIPLSSQCLEPGDYVQALAAANSAINLKISVAES